VRDDLTPGRVKAARGIAVLADAIQIGLLPLFLEGFLSPVNAALDVAVAIGLFALVGWHWAFLPGFVAEMVPVLGLVPTWTAAVLIATRNAGGSPAIDVTPSVSVVEEEPPGGKRTLGP
jgi:hypothetical protein